MSSDPSRHKFSANEFSNIKRKIERLISSDEADVNTVHRISSTLNWAAKSSPPISRRFWNRSKTTFRNSIDDLLAAEKALIEKLGLVEIELGDSNQKNPDITTFRLYLYSIVKVVLLTIIAIKMINWFF